MEQGDPGASPEALKMLARSKRGPSLPLLGALAATFLFGLLAWVTFGPGWDFGCLSLAASSMLRVGPWARAYIAIPQYFGFLAVFSGALLALLFLIRWNSTRRVPRRLAGALTLLGGGTLVASGIKEILPRMLGALGYPFSLAIGYPSGHATMALGLGLAVLLLAPPRWRPGAVALAGFVPAFFNYCLFRGGYHVPGDILGSVLLILLLSFPVMALLPSRSSAPSRREILPALLMGGLGLVWLLAGCLLFLEVPLQPGRMQALAAFDVSWRLVVGSALLAPALVAWRLSGALGRWTPRLAGLFLLAVVTFAGADAFLQYSRTRSMECNSRADLEEQLLRQAWLHRAENELIQVGDMKKWMKMGRGWRWEFAAQVPHRVRGVERALLGFRSSPMSEAERQALLRVEEDWSRLRSGLVILEAQARGPNRELPGPNSELIERLREQARLRASLDALINLVTFPERRT